MRAPSLIVPCSLSLSLICHIAFLAWFPNLPWLAGSSSSDNATGLMVSIVVSGGEQITSGDEQTSQAKTLAANLPSNDSKTKTDKPSSVDSIQKVPSVSNEKAPAVNTARASTVNMATAPESDTETIPEQITGDIRVALNTPIPAKEKNQKNEKKEREETKEEKKKETVKSILATAGTTPHSVKQVTADASLATKTDNPAIVATAREINQPRASQSKRYQLGAPHTPKPKYPRIAVQRRWQGEVLIAMQVRADGTPAKVTVKKGSGYAVLDNSALKVLAKWRLAPSQQALETLYIPVIFRL